MEDDDAERQHGAEVWAAMNSVLLKLQDLSDELSAQQGADAKKTDELESSICKAIYDLGNAAAAPETRMMGSFLPSTARFVETSGGGLRQGYHSDGVVFKARDSETGETVALKTLLEFDEEEEEENAFISYNILLEACFMAACRGHPSIVGLSAIARHPDTGHYSLVMDHVGPSLHDVLVYQRRRKPFPEPDVRRIMRQVLSGAKTMHDRGVVHHSIHSMNIFVTDHGGKGVVKIGDYRDAMSISETTVGFAARLSHVAPECFLEPLGRDNDEDMDSWSMGCLMLELLTGVDHFGAGIDDDENDAEVRLQRIDDVLGLSDERIMEDMKVAVDVELSPEVQRYRVQWRGGDRLRELVPREVLSDRGLAVLQGLLMYSPKGRLTASSALRHPWFRFTDTFNRPKPRPFTWVLVGVVALFSLMVLVCHRRLWC